LKKPADYDRTALVKYLLIGRGFHWINEYPLNQ
jgi:hypothetical protein